MKASYYENWKDSPLPVIRVRDERLDLFASYGVEIHAVAGCALRGGSFKLPAMGSLLDAALQEGLLGKGTELWEGTSGRSGGCLARLARKPPYEVADVVCVMNLDTPHAKRGAIVVAGARVVTPHVGLTPAETARVMGGGGWRPDGWRKNGNILNLGQYDNPAIKNGYRDWATQKIIKQVGEFDLLVSPVGTGGTVIGLSEGFKSLFPVIVVGALCADGHEIPGMRDEARMKEVTQPWREAVDHIIKVDRDTAFLCAPWLDWGTQIPAGPSGGATYVAFCRFIQNLIELRELDRIRNYKTGKIKALFVIHDDVMPYVADRFMTEFALDNFHESTAKSPKQLVFGSS